jgi:ATP phosphoribosyltransferase regulatory subunit
MLALALEATGHFGLPQPDIRTGDVGLFAALIGALDLAPPWRRRLMKDFNRKTNLAHDLERLAVIAAQERPEYQGVLAALAGSDPKGAHALVTDLLSIAGISAVGGRTVGEIADRFLEQAALGSGSGLPHEVAALIKRFLAIAGDPDAAAGELRTLTADAGVALDRALDLFESRTGFLAARGVDVSRIRFATSFGRGFDYYTGFVFELHDPKSADNGQLVAGGRYDGLLTRLGSAVPIPAVGFAAGIDKLVSVRGGA